MEQPMAARVFNGATVLGLVSSLCACASAGDPSPIVGTWRTMLMTTGASGPVTMTLEYTFGADHTAATTATRPVHDGIHPGCVDVQRVTGVTWTTAAPSSLTFDWTQQTETVERAQCTNTTDDHPPAPMDLTNVPPPPSGPWTYTVAGDTLTLESPMQAMFEFARE
jgi:hypothetical protein